MKIVVLMKEVPDTYGEKKVSLETGLVERQATEPVVDEITERAVELAVSHAESADEDVEVIVMSMAPSSAVDSIRKGLAMGADRAVQICDESLRGADLGQTSEALAAALKLTGFDLIIAGNVSTDGASGMLPSMLAEHLQIPAATGLSEVTITHGKVAGTRVTEESSAQVSAQLPAIVSITEALPDPRFPSFKGIMGAKKKKHETYSLEDLSIASNNFTVPRSIMVTIAERPPREAGVKVVDEGDAAVQLADFLTSNALA